MAPTAIETDNLKEKRNKKSCALQLLKEIFEKLDEFEKDSLTSLRSLKSIFKSREYKKHLLNQIDAKDFVKFQTVWDGIKNLLKTIEKEKDRKAIKADQILLTEDIKKIKNFVLEKKVF